MSQIFSGLVLCLGLLAFMLRRIRPGSKKKRGKRRENGHDRAAKRENWYYRPHWEKSEATGASKHRNFLSRRDLVESGPQKKEHSITCE